MKYDAIKVENKGNYKCIASNGAKDAQEKSVNAEKIVNFDVLSKFYICLQSNCVRIQQ